MNIVDPILFQCRRQPPVAAICVPGPGIGLISYRRLETFVHNISRRLLGFGLPAGSIVAVGVSDVIFHTAIVLALTRLGMITMSVREGDVLGSIRVAALIVDSRQVTSNIERIALADLSWTEGDGRPLEPHLVPQTSENDICRIIPTSGTTNEPKGVAISHRLLADRMARHLTVFGNRFGNCQRIYSDVPISSSLGFQSLIYALWRGGTMFFPGDNFQNTLQAFEQYRVQALVGSPGGYENLLRWYEKFAAYQSDIEVLFCGGDVLSRSLSERLRARICSHVIAAYGSTEASMSATAHAHEIAHVPRAVGYITPGVAVQVVDPSDTVLPHGEEGAIRIRSAFAVDGYFENPEASAKVFRNGWFYPGDNGTLSADDLLIVTGREQSVLNVGGDKVNPEAVEAAIAQFEGVTEVGAFTAPSDLGINEIRAVVVGDRVLDEAQLRAHCAALLPPAFVPTRFLFAERLPRNEMGKVERRLLPTLAGLPAERGA
jgi:acyl-coenzyme A synthetase/AMP-(fatty) acid ligase